MKRKTTILFAAVACLLINSSSFAQYKWSAGYQLGIGTFNTVNPIYSFGFYLKKNNDVSLSNNIYLNKQISKKITVEGALGFSSWNDIQRTDIFLAIGAPQQNKDIVETSNKSYNFTLSMKYNFFTKKQMSLWIPIGINNVYFNSEQKYFQEQQTFNLQNQKDDRLLLAQNIFTGLEANWQLNKRFYIKAQTIIGYKINEALASWDLKVASNNDNASFVSYSLNGGIGYRF